MSVRAAHRDALRILFAIQAGSAPLSDPSIPDVCAIFRGESRLLAFEFWIRNPDYLAAELLDLFEQTGNNAWLTAAEAIFQEEEPDLRRVPMIRYFCGAFDRLDDALSLLRARDLIRITGTKNPAKVQETDFLLTHRGALLCTSCLAQAPILRWYADRAALVAKVAGDRGGSALKQRQYDRAVYASTTLGGVIPPISTGVKARLEEIKDRPRSGHQ
jgi:hypothetical protein